MPKFNDNQNRTWNLAIDIPIAKRIRNQLEVDILNIEEGLPKLAADPILLCDVLWMLCEEQAVKAGVSDEEFGRSLVGESIEAAGDALIEALLAFSPPRQRKLLESTTQAGLALQEMLTGMVTTQIPMQIKNLQSILGVTSRDSPESSDTSQPELSAT